MSESSLNLFFDSPECESTSPSFRRGSRANRFQLLAAVEALVTTVTSGRRSSESFASYGPDGSWVKTSVDCSLFQAELPSEPFFETWPTWGTAWGGAATALTKPRDFATSAIESSSLATWPTARVSAGGYCYSRGNPEDKTLTLEGAAEMWMTPMVPNGGRSVPAEIVEAKGKTIDGKRTVVLESQAAVWATPSTSDGNGAQDSREGGPSLRVEATNWPTARAMDGREKGAAEGKMASLGHVAQNWPTPDAGVTTRSNRSLSPNAADRPCLAKLVTNWATPCGNQTSDRSQGRESDLREQAATFPSQDLPSGADGPNCSESGTTLLRPSQGKRRLNYRFVQHLMGFPDGWL